MTGIIELEKLLSSINPKLVEGEFIFCTLPGKLSDYAHLNPLSSFIESEGLSLVLSKDNAESANIKFEHTYRQITLTVHSSLEAVGLTAAISTKLASKNISANVIAAFFHDHIFVQSDKSEDALKALHELSTTNNA
ncbi:MULTISPECIES: ACT domain-containing protein [Gammaproteobacteria]|uniref:ACT domain-containing protein n=1 Tax=Gammaproteobacteria TaxID=1236 RepID=UPI001AD9C239|nr:MULTISPECIES: ACT domain-containing protein [Gammaproteobacteria]MBO9482232.1 ACT domain-containing protein [Salinisphaera sp. G21_0]MBO9495570.1 ACT domain-containing protein [Thalassotalea sp. G20_0]